MSAAITPIPFIHTPNISQQTIEELNQLASDAKLPLLLKTKPTATKLTQKTRQQLSDAFAEPVFIFDDKQVLSLLIDGISASPNWVKLQRRVVSAGRKSELLLQACKLTHDSVVLDATAGFGHDSLILASTGANVTMLERSPLIALLLLHEQSKMAQYKNWQKLMARLHIRSAESTQCMEQTPSKYDVVYLDPMFPDGSYAHTNTDKGAKVGKHMQALHQITQPPDMKEENHLLESAMYSIVTGGRVIVKRPISAPNLANRPADEVWQNNVVRFDGYFK